jgi:hypothetical protein
MLVETSRCGIVVLLSLLLAAGCTGDSGEDAGEDEFLPWRIETLPGGRSRVFGITLGETRFDEARRWLGDGYRLGIFGRTGDVLNLEAYYAEVTLGPLSARIVLNLGLAKERLRGMRERSPGDQVLGASDERRWSVAEVDVAEVLAAPVEAITYVPLADLSPEVVQSRFGEPQERLPGDQAEHWLYPQLGLDVVLQAAGRDVLQYVRPDRFEGQLREPLLRQNELPEIQAEQGDRV